MAQCSAKYKRAVGHIKRTGKSTSSAHAIATAKVGRGGKRGKRRK